MPRIVKVAATQFACCESFDANVEEGVRMVREAAAAGANIVLLQELFKGLYFCQEQDAKYFDWACVAGPDCEFLNIFRALAKELNVVLPISFFERQNNAFFNSIAIINTDGEILGIYRKSHIPDGPGYSEKFYFSPGDTGFKVFDTAFGCIGVAICWDQWFPEAARAMALMGAEIIFYPTAIGSEPQDPMLDSAGHWERTMVGHSAANLVPVVASNRIGTETFPKSHITFYGSSFITGSTGEILQRASRTDRAIITADLDLDLFQKQRHSWGLFRDRRPELYGTLLTKDGVNRSEPWV
jgi:N-carbamoylputrescine amidase